jgi:acetyltransferase EpsM
MTEDPGKAKPKKLVVIGGPGNGSLVWSTMLDINRAGTGPRWELVGFLNDFESSVLGFPVLGPVVPETVSKLLREENLFLLFALFSPKNRQSFGKRLEELNIPHDRLATLIHPSAVVSELATVGSGVCIQPLAAVGPSARLGDHVTLFSQSYVAHDAELADYSYVANNASVGAYVKLEVGAYIGTNSAIREHVTVGRWSFVGMGSVVVSDVEEFTCVVGNPARKRSGE